MEQDLFDCIVIGAGPAGLSASLFLARYRRNVLTLHDNNPRNIYSQGIHGFLGHHGIKPADLLARGFEEVLNHGGRIVEARATKIDKSGDGLFTIKTTRTDQRENRTYQTRRVLLATGLRDILPTCAGFRDFYGSTVYHCPDCDGYEVSGKRVAVLGHGDGVVGLTLDLLTWTEELTLLTDGHAEEINQEGVAKLAAFNITIRNEKVLSLEGDVETRLLQRVRFSTGETLECDALFFNLGVEPVCRLHEALGCKTTKDFLWVDKTQQTSVEGIYAAGDITPNSHLAVVAAAEGAMAAIHIHQSLLPESRRV